MAAQPAPEAWGQQTRITVPVMSATGGAGRSTISGLSACSLAAVASTVVLDTTGHLSSPWPGWAVHRGGGLAALPADRPLPLGAVRSAVSRCAGPAGEWELLTDHRPWQTAPLPLPTDPDAWRQLSALGSWQAVVVDTSHLVADDIMAARWAGGSGLTARWCGLPHTVPVLAAMATGTGVAALQTAVMAAEADGLPLQRTVIAVSTPSDGRPPATVRAALTMLERKVGAVCTVPYDPRIRAHGLLEPSRLRPATLRAAHELAAAIGKLARAAWGDPLPAAALPALVTPEGIRHVPDSHRVATARSTPHLPRVATRWRPARRRACRASWGRPPTP